MISESKQYVIAICQWISVRVAAYHIITTEIRCTEELRAQHNVVMASLIHWLLLTPRRRCYSNFQRVNCSGLSVV